jgi:hypothetical protein
LRDGSAESGAQRLIDAELVEVVNAWPNLPEPIRQAMLTLARTARIEPAAGRR